LFEILSLSLCSTFTKRGDDAGCETQTPTPTQDFMIDEFARLPIEHRERVKIFEGHHRGDEVEK
jgi:hypothetical protein